MPKVAKVGDIIRIQNVNCSEYKGQRQFNANLTNFHNKSSWAIFEGDIESLKKQHEEKNKTEKDKHFIAKESFEEKKENQNMINTESYKAVDFDPYEPIHFSGE